MSKDLLQMIGVDVRAVRQIQNRLDPIRRRRLDSLGFEVGILEAVNGSVHAGGSYYWAAVPSGLDDNGFARYSAPFMVRASSAGSPVLETRGHPILIRKAYDGVKEIVGTDAPTFESAGGNIKYFNVIRPENALIYLNNVVRLQSRPISNTQTSSTLVNVQRSWYDDDHGFLQRYKGTDLLAEKLDLASYIPAADKHQLTIVLLKTFDNTLQVVQGVERDLDDPMVVPDDYQDALKNRDPETIPIQAYLLRNNESYIDITSLDIDLRQFINVPRLVGFPGDSTLKIRIRANYRQLSYGRFEEVQRVEVYGGLRVLATAAGEVTISGGGGGEANTASNVGVGGVGPYKDKSGVDLQFKNINVGSSYLTIADDTGNDEIDIDQAIVTTNAGTPSGAPGLVGKVTIDTTNDRAFIGTDTVANTDHKRIDAGMVLLASGQEASNVASVTISGWVDDNREFSAYKLMVTGLRTNKATDYKDHLLATFNSDTTATNYNTGWMNGREDAAVSGDAPGTAVGIYVTGCCAAVNSNSGCFGFFEMTIFMPENTNDYKVCWLNGGIAGSANSEYYVMNGEGMWESAAAISSITLTPDSGTMFEIGGDSEPTTLEWRLYGVF